MGAHSEPGEVATGLSEPQPKLPTEQLLAKTEIALPETGTQAARSTNFHHASRSTRTTSATPQVGPPVFTDDPLNDQTLIKSLHVTELRSWIDQLRVRAGLAAANWQQPVGIGLLVSAAPTQELRTKLDEALSALHLSCAIE
jgi:hypothetical protein